MSKVLVTGGAGMIGSCLVKKLVELNHEVLIIDNLWRGKLEYLNDFATNTPCIDLKKNFFNIDLSEPVKDIEPFRGVDYIYHLADVVAGIGYVFSNQGSIFRQNVLINSNTIDMAKQL